MEGKQINDTVGESSRSGSAPMASPAYSPMASAAYSRPLLPRKSFSSLSMRRPGMNNSSSSSYTSGNQRPAMNISSSSYTSRNHTPNFYVRYRREKVGDFASSSRPEMSERDRELKVTDQARKSKSTSELKSSENRHVSVGRDDEIDYYLLKESSKLKQIVTSDRFAVKPLKNSTSRQYSGSGNNFEKKSVVSDRTEFLLKPVKKRIISEIMNETSVKQKGNTPPVSLKMNSGRSSEKLKEHSNTAPKAKSNKMVFRLGTKTKSIDDAENGGSLSPFTAADFAPKTWNLRPRQRPVSNSKGKGPNLQGSMADGKTAEAQKNEKTKKTEFSISLSKAEIEADFLAMTGSKPPRKLQKRGRVVQKNLDYCFPGLWLHSITPNSYRVPDEELKI